MPKNVVPAAPIVKLPTMPVMALVSTAFAQLKLVNPAIVLTRPQAHASTLLHSVVLHARTAQVKVMLLQVRVPPTASARLHSARQVIVSRMDGVLPIRVIQPVVPAATTASRLENPVSMVCASRQAVMKAIALSAASVPPVWPTTNTAVMHVLIAPKQVRQALVVLPVIALEVNVKQQNALLATV